MAKRKTRSEDVDVHMDDASDNESGEDISMIDVDFEFFDPNPDIDYHALKRLITQIFQADAAQLHTHELAELILGQPLVGTTIKTDGRESDPYAFLTVLNMHVHKEHPSIKALAAYALQKAATDPSCQAALQSLFSQDANHVGFVFSERLINMPVQVVPPMYRCLADEIKWAVDDNEPYTFSHLLFFSRTYHISEEEAEAAAQAPANPSKRQKQKQKQQQSTRAGAGLFSFHPEDEIIRKVASHTVDFSFSAEPREKDAFGLDVRGRMMVVPAAKLTELVGALENTFRAP